MAPYSIRDGSVDGLPTVTLASELGGVEATFAPGVGMVGCSLRHAGDELLEDRGGLRRYAGEGGTMGIPLLHPWANRLSELSFEVAGRRVALDAESPLVRLDPGGLPIHGLLAASPHWTVEERHADHACARLAARLDFAAHAELMAAFPFPHLLQIEVRLEAATLTIATTLRATGDGAVPVSFGYHPYFRLPDAPAREWEVSLPVRRHVEVDERMIPTGESEPVSIEPGPLGDRTYDDGYDRLEDPAGFVLAGGGRRLTMEFLEGYPIAVVWRPPNGDFICFEPMTARTNALVAGAPDLRLVDPGGRYTAAFAVGVERTD